MTLVYLSVAWACGIWLAHVLWSQGVLSCATPWWPAALISGVAACAAIALRRHASIRWGALLLACLLLGLARYQGQPFAACPTTAHLAFYNDIGKSVTVEGVIAAYPDLRDTTGQYELRAERVMVDGATYAVRGVALVQAPRYPVYHYGDRVRITGRLETPPLLDDFDYRAYLAQGGVHSLLRRADIALLAEGQGQSIRAFIYRVRSAGSALLNRLLPEPAAALANGILLGLESGIPADLDDAFKRTGASHIIVISGSNMALFAGVFMSTLSRLVGKRRAAWPAMTLVVLYVLLAGDGPAAQRAGLMSCLLILATYLGRQNTAYISLCAAGLVMTIANPLTLWDTGFRLSFLATLGMILLTRPLDRLLTAVLTRWLPAAAARPTLGLLRGAVVVTLAAQALTLPLIVAVFGRLPLISLVTNFLILPVQPLVMMGGLATLLGGFLWEPLGRVLAVVPWFFLSYTTAVVRATAALPFAAVEIGAAGRTFALLPYAGLLAYGLGRLLHAQGRLILPSKRTALWAAGVLAPLALLATTLTVLPDGRLHIRYVMAGESEAALIVTPGGQRVWVWDGQGDGAQLVAATGGRVDVILVPAASAPSVAALWPDALPVAPDDLPPGSVLRLDEGVTLTRLDVRDAWALRLTYGEFATWLPVTLRPEAQASLVEQHAADELRVTVLKAPIAGTGAWPAAGFLAQVAPQMILWPEGTTYPPDVDAALVAAGAVRTVSTGVVEVTTDGAQVWVEQGDAARSRVFSRSGGLSPAR